MKSFRASNPGRLILRQTVPSPEQRRLLEALWPLARRFLLIVQPQLGLSPGADAILSALSPFLESDSQVSEWPGTTLLDHTARCFTYRASAGALSIILREATDLFGWQQPERPEDPALLRTDGSAILATTAHEGFAIVSLEDSELDLLPAHARRLYDDLPPDEGADEPKAPSEIPN